MTRSDKLFERLFPGTALNFDVRLSAATLGIGAEGNANDERIWLAALSADVLLIRAASYRETFDLFSRPKFWTELFLFSQLSGGETGMAAKGQRKQEDRAAWKGFLDFRLSDGQLEELDAWKPKPTEIFTIIDQMLADDFRLTLSYNKRTKLSSCTIIDDSPARKSGGFALSTQDDNGAAALKAAVYKHYTVLQGDWLPLLDTSSKSRRG